MFCKKGPQIHYSTFMTSNVKMTSFPDIGIALNRYFSEFLTSFVFVTSDQNVIKWAKFAKTGVLSVFNIFLIMPI